MLALPTAVVHTVQFHILTRGPNLFCKYFYKLGPLSQIFSHGVLYPILYNNFCFKVCERMARNLVNIGRQMGQMGDGMLALRTAVEIFTEICPDEIDSRILLARLYLHLGINLQEV